MKRSLDNHLGVVDDARRIYNRPCSNQPALDAKGGDRTKESVAHKVAEVLRLPLPIPKATLSLPASSLQYCCCFAPSAKVVDLMSGRAILPTQEAFSKRFATVFRESGPDLELAVRSRTVFSTQGGTALFVLDLERHSSLTTPVGPMLDGSLGLRGPRVQDLWVLYEVKNGRLAELWLHPASGDASGEAAVAVLKAGREWGAFEAHVRQGLGPGYETQRGPLHSVRVGQYEMQGRRNTMEDKLVTLWPSPPQRI